jgi:methylenetetrahydrofolate dehydrogenase (NAD+)
VSQFLFSLPFRHSLFQRCSLNSHLQTCTKRSLFTGPRLYHGPLCMTHGFSFVMAASAESTTQCKVILANKIAQNLLAEINAGLKELQCSPHLVGFLSSADPAARVYAEWTGKTCKDNGFRFSLREVDRELLEEAIMTANEDPDVDGIIVYYPIFGNRQDQYLQQIVDISKDVEGLSHRYLFNMYQNIRFLDEAQTKKSVLPCTPLAVIKILEYLQIYNTILPYGNRLHGHTITVINRSEVVGRPLAALLANDGANVYSVDIDSVQRFHRGEGLKKKRHDVEELPGWTIENALPLSDVVVSGVPGENYKVPLQLLREGAVCINFSSERVSRFIPLDRPDSNRKQNFAPEVKQKASIYVPAIGKVTIVVLLRNLLRIVQNRKDLLS